MIQHFKLLNLLTNKILIFILSLVLVIVGYLIDSFILLAIGSSILSIMISVLFTFILNPICGIKNKVIFKGNHRPLLQIPFCLPRYVKNKNVFLSKNIKLTESCYTNHNHINNLFGFTVGGLFENSIHKNSFRIGYMSEKGNLYFMAYYYLNGERFYKKLMKINCTDSYRMTIHRSRKNVMFEVLNNNKGVLRKFKVEFESKSDYGYMTGIYYGGKDKAPHKINFKVW